MFKLKMKAYYTDWFVKANLYIDIIFMVICTIISVILFKWNIWMYIPAFIASQILYFVLREIFSFGWNIFYWRWISLEDKKILLKEMKQSLDDFYPDSDVMCELSTDIEYLLGDFIEEIETELNEKEKSIETVSTEIEGYLLTLKSFKSKANTMENNFDLTNNLFNKLDKIVELVKETPATSVFVNKIFNIYLPETIILFDKIPMHKDDKEYLENLNIVLKEIDKLATTTIETVEDYNRRSDDIAFEVLIREIQKTEEGMKHGNRN